MGYQTSYSLTVQHLSKAVPGYSPDWGGVQKQILKRDLEEALAEARSPKDVQEALEASMAKVVDFQDPQEIIDLFRATCDSANWAFNSHGYSEESHKWYEHEQDLQAFSAQYPDWLFTLDGEGEEAGDIWRKYFVAGESQTSRPEIIHTPPDFTAFGVTGASQ